MHVQEPREAMVYRLLDKVLAAELVAATIRSKVVPYLQRHKLKLDTILLKYLKVVRRGGVGVYIHVVHVVTCLYMFLPSSSWPDRHGNQQAWLGVRTSPKLWL